MGWIWTLLSGGFLKGWRTQFVVLVCAIVVAFLLFALPAVAEEIAPPDMTVDLTPIVDYFIYAALSVVAAVGAWAIRLVSKWIGIKTDDALAARIRLGLENGLRAAYDKNKAALLGSSIKPTVRNQILLEAAQYVIDRFPDATRHFRIERPEQLADMAAALLPKIETELVPPGRGAS